MTSTGRCLKKGLCFATGILLASASTVSAGPIGKDAQTSNSSPVVQKGDPNAEAPLAPSTEAFTSQKEPEEQIQELVTMSLVELLNIVINVSSLFGDSELTAGAAVSWTDRSQWRNSTARSLNEAMYGFPSVTAYESLGGSYLYAIRGYATKLSARGIATQLDGIPLNTLSFGTAQYLLPNVELSTLDRIEVIRGPGSALYGSDAFHGVMSLRTFSSEADTIETELEAGTSQFVRAGIRVSEEVLPGLRLTAAFGASGQRPIDLPYEYTVAADEMLGTLTQTQDSLRQSEYNSQSANLKASYYATDALTLGAGFYVNRYQAEGTPGLGTDLLRNRDVTASEALLAMVRTTAALKLPHHITADAEYYFWIADNNQRHAFVDNNDFCMDMDDYRQGTRLTVKQSENRLKSRWSLRYEYSFSKTHNTRFDVVPRGTCKSSSKVLGQPFEDLSRNVHSVLGQNKTSLLDDHVHILMGGRMDHYSDFGTQLTPRAGLILQPSQNSALKLLTSNAFRAPVGSELTWSGKVKGDPHMRPEVITTYEAIYMHGAEHWRASIGLFKNYWRNGIIVIDRAPEDFEGQFDSDYKNIGKLEAEGIEAETAAQLGNLTVSLNGSIVRSRDVTEGDDGMSADREFAAFPRYIVNASASYGLPQYTASVHAKARLMLDMRESPDPVARGTESLPPYVRVDIVADKQIDNMLLSFKIKNLLNRTNAVPGVWGVEGGVLEDGISATGEVSYRF